MVVVDREGVIVLWNAGAERLFGHTPDEALGRPLDIIIPEKLRERHWVGFEAAVAHGALRDPDRTLAVPALRRDGSRVSLEFSIGLIRDGADDRLVAIAAIMRDVTTRFERDRALRARLAELEGRR